MALKDITAAEAPLREATNILQRIFGQHHPKVADGLNNLAAVEESKGNLNAALELHRSALQIRQAHFGEAHLLTAISLHNIAALLMKQGDLEQASEYFQQALPTLENQGRQHPAYAAIQNNIAVIRYLRGESTEHEMAAAKTVTLSQLGELTVLTQEGRAFIPVRFGQSHQLMTLVI